MRTGAAGGVALILFPAARAAISNDGGNCTDLGRGEGLVHSGDGACVLAEQWSVKGGSEFACVCVH